MAFPSQVETPRKRTVLYRGVRPSAENLIAELQATAATLERALQAELQVSPSKDPKAATYSMLARSLVTRLDNVRSTLAALEASHDRMVA